MQFLLELSHFLHTKCLEFGPNSEYKEIYQAIVCGSNLVSPDFVRVFRDSGLIHIIVVSGSHLIFLSEFLIRLKIRSKLLHSVILFFYVLICRVEAPALRSFFVFILSTLNQRYVLFMPIFYQHLISAAICLLLFPHWSNSFSLKLSLLASIGLSLVKGHAKQCLVIFLLLIPIISFSPLQISSLINNIIYAQIVGVVLFPLSLVTFALPIIVPLSDLVWLFCIRLLEFINSYFLQPAQNYYFLPRTNTYQWLYICVALYFTRKRI